MFNNIRFGAWIYPLALLVLFSVSCAQKKGGGGDLGDDATNLQNPFDGSEVEGALGGPDLQSGSGTLTQADKNALNNLTDQYEDVEPQNDGLDVISKALEQKMKELIAQEKQGKDVAMQKLALAGQMMEACTQRIGMFAPRPGQPLLGQWSGKGCAKPSGKYTVPGGTVAFNVIDPNDKGPGKASPPLKADAKGDTAFAVTGATQGKMAVKADGSGIINGQPWAGPVSDRGLSGRSGAGTVTNKAYNQTKYGPQACNMGVALRSSRNPIPENYIEGMRMAGKCFRQTLFFMSPTMDNMFKGMDPQLAQILKMRLLGMH